MWRWPGALPRLKASDRTEIFVLLAMAAVPATEACQKTPFPCSPGPCFLLSVRGPVRCHLIVPHSVWHTPTLTLPPQRALSKAGGKASPNSGAGCQCLAMWYDKTHPGFLGIRATRTFSLPTCNNCLCSHQPLGRLCEEWPSGGPINTPRNFMICF